MEPAIEATGLEKSYGPLRVLGGVDLGVARGSVFALLGPNGAGKTTMVRILATLVRADAGRARAQLVGDPAHAQPGRALAVQHAQGGVDDRLPGQGRAGRPLARGGLPGRFGDGHGPELYQSPNSVRS